MRLSVKEIDIDEEQVLKFLGYGTKKPPAIILKKMEEEIIKAQSLIEPEVIIDKVSLRSIADEKVIFGSGHEIESNYVSKELKNSSYVYIALYTVGSKIEEKICEYSNSSEMIRAMILDKIGIVSLDCLNERIKEKIKEEIGELNISAELYPSQNDFDISNQKLIFDLLKKESSVMRINSYNQFSPIKTVAVVFGVGEAELGYTRCENCDENCGL